jgi:hypothetical protein
MTLDKAGKSKGFAFVEFELEVGSSASLNTNLKLTQSTERCDIVAQRK